MTAPNRFLAVVIAVLVAVSAGVVSCSGDEEAAPSTTTTSSTLPTPRQQLEDIELVVDIAELVSPQQPLGPLPDDVRDQIVEVLDSFLKLTSAGPMITGQPGGGWGVLLTPDALDRAKEADRPALVEDGVPRSRRIQAERAGVNLRGLAAADGALQLAVAEIDWLVTGRGGSRPVGVHRTGELTLVPGPQGGWLISAYDMRVVRTLGNPPRTTTTEAKGGG